MQSLYSPSPTPSGLQLECKRSEDSGSDRSGPGCTAPLAGRQARTGMTLRSFAPAARSIRPRSRCPRRWCSVRASAAPRPWPTRPARPSRPARTTARRCPTCRPTPPTRRCPSDPGRARSIPTPRARKHILQVPGSRRVGWPLSRTSGTRRRTPSQSRSRSAVSRTASAAISRPRISTAGPRPTMPGHVLRARAPAPLVLAAVLDGDHLGALADVEPATPLGP